MPIWRGSNAKKNKKNKNKTIIKTNQAIGCACAYKNTLTSIDDQWMGTGIISLCFPAEPWISKENCAFVASQPVSQLARRLPRTLACDKQHFKKLFIFMIQFPWFFLLIFSDFFFLRPQKIELWLGVIMVFLVVHLGEGFLFLFSTPLHINEIKLQTRNQFDTQSRRTNRFRLMVWRAGYAWVAQPVRFGDAGLVARSS